MADDTDTITGSARRWSRRKLGRKLDADQGLERHSSSPADAKQDATVPEDLKLFDFESLGFSSDFTRFMRCDVPSHLRTKGLKALWTSHDTISRPDDLDDYLEDFSEEAMALPPELARSAYEIGFGFLNSGQCKDDGSNTQEHSTDVVPSASDQSQRPSTPDDRTNDLESDHCAPDQATVKKP